MRDTAGVGAKIHVGEGSAEGSEARSSMRLGVSYVEHKAPTINQLFQKIILV